MRLFLIAAMLLPAAGHAADSTLSFSHYNVSMVVDPNFQSTETVSFEAYVPTPAAVRQISQESISFIEGMQSAEMVEGSIRKPDGKTIKLNRDAARPVDDRTGAAAPAYDDHKRLIVVFPELGVGDTVTLTMRKRTQQPLFPGAFMMNMTFSPLVGWQDANITLDTPSGMPITVETKDVTNESNVKDDRRVIHWHFAAPGKASDPAILSPLDRAPRVFASSFPDWPALGRAWGAIALPKAVVSEAVQKRADEITTGISDRRAQASAIYAWIGKTIGTVPLALGSGSFEPATADTVLGHGYGDSKDTAVLAVALLKARGINAELVLLNSNTSYHLSQVPNIASMDHVIVYLPEWSLYFDPTAHGAPFGSLPFLQYGKTALRISADAATLEKIPILQEVQAATHVTTNITLSADGRVEGDTLNTAEGPFAIGLRRIGAAVTANNSSSAKRVAAAMLHSLGAEGGGSFNANDPTAVTPTAMVKSHFELSRQPGWLEGEAFVMPAGMRLLPHVGDQLLGPLELRDLPTTEPTPCFSGLQEETITLTLPPGNKLGRLPADVKIQTPTFLYESSWKTEPGMVHLHRSVEARFTTPLCEGSVRAEAANAAAEIRREQNTRIWLERQ